MRLQASASSTRTQGAAPLEQPATTRKRGRRGGRRGGKRATAKLLALAVHTDDGGRGLAGDPVQVRRRR